MVVFPMVPQISPAPKSAVIAISLRTLYRLSLFDSKPLFGTTLIRDRPVYSAFGRSFRSSSAVSVPKIAKVLSPDT